MNREELRDKIATEILLCEMNEEEPRKAAGAILALVGAEVVKVAEESRRELDFGRSHIRSGRAIAAAHSYIAAAIRELFGVPAL